MPVTIEPSAPSALAAADLKPRGPVYPSPADWRDQTFYFLLPDRFSDGQEGERPLFDFTQPELFKVADKGSWARSGRGFQGGTLKGIQSKLAYLQGLGVTALWIGPVWQQRPDLDTYHGYGIQNFLEVDSRFGTRQDLRNLVDAAHERDMYVLLDVIYNHSGNNWFYKLDNTRYDELPYRFSPPYEFHGWHSATGASISQITSVQDGVWPQEFQTLEWYTRAGKIIHWDPEPWENPLHPDAEFRRGDFFSLKDLNQNLPEVLGALIQVYQYWIALSDCDGFRIDTVKHVSWEASRNFCGALHEFTESIGKNNFLLLGEVTGGADMARNYLEIFGRNLDAVLDIGNPAKLLGDWVKGQRSADEFFDQFTGHDILGTHRETGRYHVSILDDHDMVGRGKQRFAANNHIPQVFEQTAHAVGVQLTTLGIPCIYYGTEQAFDGSEAQHEPALDPEHEDKDRYIRESMFGGSFGAFETTGCHFFNADHPTYQHMAAIARIRNRKDLVGLALRRGRQYPRETSFLEKPFTFPQPGELIGWSRILFSQEVLIVLNTHGTEPRGAEVTIDKALHAETSTLTYLYQSNWTAAQLMHPPTDQTVSVQYRNGRAVVRIDVLPAGMAILA